jgi:hypothetical protein
MKLSKRSFFHATAIVQHRDAVVGVSWIGDIFVSSRFLPQR